MTHVINVVTGLFLLCPSIFRPPQVYPRKKLFSVVLLATGREMRERTKRFNDNVNSKKFEN